MKVGDLVCWSQLTGTHRGSYLVNGETDAPKGIILEFIPASHPKQVQKVKVLSEGQIMIWALQFCKVINESR